MKDDASLVAGYLQGNAAAFEELYARHLRPIFGAVYMRTHHRETTEDIVSQTFLQALQRIESFDPSKGPFGGWLHRIARNLVIDHYRALRPSSPVEDIWDLEDGTDVKRDASVALQMQAIRTHMAKLKPAQRDIVLLRVWYQYSFKEIADAMGMTEAACKMSYGRSLKTLQASFVLLLLFFSLFSHGLPA